MSEEQTRHEMIEKIIRKQFPQASADWFPKTPVRLTISSLIKKPKPNDQP
jgi:hypothetical protein